MQKRGVSRFSVESYPLNKKFHRGTILCFRKNFSGIEKSHAQGGGGGVSRFSVEYFLSHKTENFCTGNASVFQKDFDIENFHA